MDMPSLRLWSVRHSRLMERVWNAAEALLVRLDPLVRRVGETRLERSVAAVEAGVKGALFGCRMCGQCALSSTGMSCPMNCPKTLRNGPCGGVRGDGRCEVDPAMTCVFVLAWDGSRHMAGGDAMLAVLPPLDHRLHGRSSWLRHLRGVRP
jgi:hypothetical protein